MSLELKIVTKSCEQLSSKLRDRGEVGRYVGWWEGGKNDDEETGFGVEQQMIQIFRKLILEFSGVGTELRVEIQ